MTSRLRSRGQALFETAIAMPLFLFVLFGAMWAIKEATMSERVQLGVRYGGVLGQLSNPYDNYSLYRLYNAVQGGTAALAASTADQTECQNGMTTVATGGRHSFFEALGAPVPTCVTNKVLLAQGTSYGGSNALSQDILLMDDFAQFKDAVTTGGYLQTHVFGTSSSPGSGNTGLNAIQNFFRSPDIGNLADCTQIGGQLALSFSPMIDNSSPSPASPLPLTLDGSPLKVTSTGGMPLCSAPATPNPQTTKNPAPPPPCSTCAQYPTPTPTPSPTPSPTPKPTPTPTPSPTPSPTPKPTATPVPTPTPTVSPTPSPTPKPTATPQPTPTPTVSPTPTATPKPTPTPTVSPTPTPTQKPTATPTATAVPTPSPVPTDTGGGVQF